MNEKIKNYLDYMVLPAITLVFCLFWGAILYYYFLPFLIKEIDKFDSLFTWELYLSLVLWSLYFWVVKLGIKTFKFKEYQARMKGVSIYFIVLGAWFCCFILSGIIYLVLDENVHRFEFSIVSFIISIPYVTFQLIKYCVLDKNIKH